MNRRLKLTVRAAQASDADDVADIWFLGWRDAHLGNVPGALLEARTEESFRERAQRRVPNTTVAVADGTIAGFVMVVGNEIEQLYIGAEHRGSGAAQRLMAYAEELVARAGYSDAWLAVVPGNSRALRFYERCGWSSEGLFEHQAPASDESGPPIPVTAYRYVKRLR